MCRRHRSGPGILWRSSWLTSHGRREVSGPRKKSTDIFRRSGRAGSLDGEGLPGQLRRHLPDPRPGGPEPGDSRRASTPRERTSFSLCVRSDPPGKSGLAPSPGRPWAAPRWRPWSGLQRLEVPGTSEMRSSGSGIRVRTGLFWVVTPDAPRQQRLHLLRPAIHHLYESFAGSPARHRAVISRPNAQQL